MGIECVILASSTISCPKGGRRVKTDRRDARNIAVWAYGGYSAAHVPSEHDVAVRDYIRMRNDHKEMLKKVKQQINSFCLRNGFHYASRKWTEEHIKYLRSIELSAINRECVDEYLITLCRLQDKIHALDVRIEEMSHDEMFKVKAGRLSYFLGITRNRAMTILSETGDFKRFSNPRSFAAYL